MHHCLTFQAADTTTHNIMGHNTRQNNTTTRTKTTQQKASEHNSRHSDCAPHGSPQQACSSVEQTCSICCNLRLDATFLDAAHPPAQPIIRRHSRICHLYSSNDDVFVVHEHVQPMNSLVLRHMHNICIRSMQMHRCTGFVFILLSFLCL